jgi:hypothetical protein
MKRYLILITLFALLAMPLLAGCRRSEPAPAPTPTSMVSPLRPTAEPVAHVGQEQPESPVPTPTPELVPGPDTGIVVGKLERARGTEIPLEERTIYLSRVMLDQEEDGFEVARMSPSEDPRAGLDADGSFIFADVQPGKYALSTVTPRGETVLLINVKTGYDIIIEVEAGEVTDLGLLRVDFIF